MNSSELVLLVSASDRSEKCWENVSFLMDDFTRPIKDECILNGSSLVSEEYEKLDGTTDARLRATLSG